MRQILDMIRRGISDLKDQNGKLKGACAAQIAARAWNKDDAYDDVLKLLDTIQAGADETGFLLVNVTWNDIKRIIKIADDLIPCTPFASVSEQIFADEFQTEESYYGEILRRYKEGLK